MRQIRQQAKVRAAAEIIDASASGHPKQGPLVLCPVWCEQPAVAGAGNACGDITEDMLDSDVPLVCEPCRGMLSTDGCTTERTKGLFV